MPQIKFTVTAEAEAYLRWYARTILFEKTADNAARHLMMHRLEQVRRDGRRNEPSADDLAVSESPDGADGD
jgi:hypothetical protein